jgi:hypothetical protein
MNRLIKPYSIANHVLMPRKIVWDYYLTPNRSTELQFDAHYLPKNTIRHLLSTRWWSV